MTLDHPTRRPEEILAYRTLQQILGPTPKAVWSVAPSDSALTALRLMAEKGIGFVVVLRQGALVGVLSERDCVRHLALAKKSLEATPVDEIMVRNVVTVLPAHTFADCLRLMHQHRIRHLPVVADGGRPVAVISVRDLLGEAVAHHAKIIERLELERLTFFTSTA
jgi:CBS domain-containing protein